ncbi:hypothetical protein ACVWYG_000524 [Pedobacter sp. UYEF25]
MQGGKFRATTSIYKHAKLILSFVKNAGCNFLEFIVVNLEKENILAFSKKEFLEIWLNC